MSLRKQASVVVAALGCFTLIGCQQPGGMAQGDEMAPPPRAAELDELETWVGSWTTDGEMIMYTPDGEQKGPAKGSGTTRWVCDKRAILSEMEFDMGEDGTMKGIELMTWDPKGKVYRSWWVDSYGSSAEGTMWKDKKTGEWISRGKGVNPDGASTSAKGTMKKIDDKTMEWTFTEYDAWGFNKTMRITGTSTMN